MYALATLITPESVKVETDSISQKKAFEQLCQLLTPMGMNISQSIYDGLLKREKLGSTAIGNGIAIPHTRVEEIESPKIAVLKTGGINWEAPDHNRVEICFGMIVPTGENQTHLNLLAEISRLLKNVDFANQLKAAQDAKALYNVLLLANVIHNDS